MKSTKTSKLYLIFFFEDIARSIEEATEQGTNAVPRVARELEATKQEASFLKRHMENVKIGLENVESKTNNSIKVLLSIDKVKERVENSEKALKKVDNWSQLVQEAELSFQDRDINSISEKIGLLDSSILIFQGAPDFSEKKKLLDQFKNRLEASLRQVFSSSNSGSLIGSRDQRTKTGWPRTVGDPIENPFKVRRLFQRFKHKIQKQHDLYTFILRKLIGLINLNRITLKLRVLK